MEKNIESMKTIFTILLILLDFFLVLLALSCGTRKTNSEYYKFQSDTLEISNSYELKQNGTFNDIFLLNPIDNTKPIIINGVSYYNASILFDKSIKKGIEIKGSENLSYSGGSGVVKTKNTTAENKNFLWIGIVFVFLLVVGGFIFLYNYLPKLKIT